MFHFPIIYLYFIQPYLSVCLYICNLDQLADLSEHTA